MTTEKKLVKKLSEVMNEVKYIQKKGYNSFHKYRYATESDVAEKVREELAQRSVMMIPNVVSQETREHTNQRGNREYIVNVMMEFTFHDGETGESISFTMGGQGQDAGDKAIYKAMTGAQKYALMKAFMIPTGDDPEADEGVDERNHAANQKGKGKQQGGSDNAITPQQVGEIKISAGTFGQMRGKTMDEVIEAAGVKEITSLTQEQAVQVIAKINGWVKKAQEEAQQAGA